MSGYAYQNVEADATISTENNIHDESVVSIDVDCGSSCNISLDLDAEDAWHFAWDVIAAATDASPELIGALTESLRAMGDAS